VTDALRRRYREDAEGACARTVEFFAKLWPATMQVNRSGGDLEAAVERAVEQLIAPLARQLEAAGETARDAALERILAAIEADQGGILAPLGAAIGHLCATPGRARRLADQLLPKVRRALATQPGRPYALLLPCATAMASAGRHAELLAMLTVGAPADFPLRRLVLDHLERERDMDQALQFLDAATCRTDQEARERAQEGERRLRLAGRHDEAFARYALAAHRAHTIRQWHEALCAAWPDRKPTDLFDALLAAHPGEEGKFFAAARAIGRPDLALALAERSPTDPKQLLHAAAEAAPGAEALQLNLIALRWLTSGRLYKATRPQVNQACAQLATLDPQGAPSTLRAFAAATRVPATRAWLESWLAGDRPDEQGRYP
jgi:hypothetical protein